MKDRVCIHGAACSIGSSCVEVASGKHHLILDYGKPLEGEGTVPFVFPHSAEKRKQYNVVISHSHADHAGFINSIPEDVPVFMTGKTKTALLLSDDKYITREVTVLEEKTIVKVADGLSFMLLQVNHSSADAACILIGTPEHNILYTGDFRNHGKDGNSFIQTIRECISDNFGEKPLILISEATNAGIPDKSKVKESALTEQFVQEFKEPGLVMVKMANQNVERLSVILEAVKKSGRLLVTEPYTALCAKELYGKQLVPDGKYWRVFNIQTKKTLELAGKNKLYQFGRARKITKDELVAKKDSIAMVANTDSERFLENKDLINRVVWSMWTGYEAYERLCKKHKVSVIHSSGHVYVEDWLDTIKTLSPVKTIIVHTQHPEEATELIKDITKPVVASTDKVIRL